MTLKHVAWIAVAVVVAGLGGWIYGASGSSAREQARLVEEQRADMAEVRAHILEGRVSLFLSNFGDASRHFESARTVLERVQSRLRETAQAERAGRLQIPISHLRDAQHLSSAFDPAAHTAAGDALRALTAVP